MKELINNKEKCHRREILKHFSGDHKIVVEGCQCCDVCAQGCMCSGNRGGCSNVFKLNFSVNETQYTYLHQRIISNEQKKELNSKLVSYANALQKDIGKQVLYPNVHMEFGSLQISQIVNNACKLFSVMDRGGKNFFLSGNLGLGLKNFCKNFTRQVCK